MLEFTEAIPGPSSSMARPQMAHQRPPSEDYSKELSLKLSFETGNIGRFLFFFFFTFLLVVSAFTSIFSLAPFLKCRTN